VGVGFNPLPYSHMETLFARDDGPRGLAFPCYEVERLRRDTQPMMALHRRPEITVHPCAGGVGPRSIGCCRQFILDGKQDLQSVTGNDRFGNAVIVKRFLRVAEKGAAVLDTPLPLVNIGAHVFPVSSEKQRQLQRGALPQIGTFIADMTAGIGKSQRVREIKPADVVGNRVVAGALERGVEMQQVERGGAQQCVVELAHRAARRSQGPAQGTLD